MSDRDYLARNNANKKKKKNAKNINKVTIFILVAIILGGFAGGLYWLKYKSKDAETVQATPEKVQPKSVLPNRPEEVWSYIKALETRTVPVDDNPDSLNKNMRLTDEQRKVLVEMEKEQKAAEAARKLAEQRKLENPVESTVVSKPEVAKAETNVKPQTTETVKKVKEPPKENNKEVAKAPVVKAEKVEIKTEVKKAESKPNNTQSASSSDKKFGLQCGAFKNKPQAENLQARLAMAGLNARVNASADWNRVVIGPVGDRATASKAQEQAKAIAGCVIIGM